MELIIGKGIDNVKFGMTRKDIINILGDFDKVDTFKDQVERVFGTSYKIKNIFECYIKVELSILV